MKLTKNINFRNLLLENDKLKQDIKSMKQELKVLKSINIVLCLMFWPKCDPSCCQNPANIKFLYIPLF